MDFGAIRLASRLGKCTAVASLAVVISIVILMAGAGIAKGADCASVSNGLGSFSKDNLPGACWRPYSDSSPFNQTVPAAPRLAPNSSAAAAALGSLSAPLNIGESRYLDGGHPTFWSQPSDPLVTLHARWSSSPISGMRIRVPAQAMPAGGFSFGTAWPDQHDSHMTIVDQASGWEYDLWNVQSMSNGVLNYTNGCRTRIDGDGLGSCGTAANFGNLAGIIRLEELKAGHIDHALFLSVPSVNGHVYPVPFDNNNSGPGAGVPKLGSHIWLDMTPAQVNALPIPAYRKTIAMALVKYGAYIGDSGNDTLGFQIESPQTYASFGRHDWNDWAQSVGGSGYRTQDGQQAWHLSLDGVPLSSKLRILDPCTADGSCPSSPDAGGDQGAGDPPAADPVGGDSVQVSSDSASGSDAGFSRTSGNQPDQADSSSCWAQRAAWARAYRRSHMNLGPRYKRTMARMARLCAARA
jgi:hypothetical protein